MNTLRLFSFVKLSAIGVIGAVIAACSSYEKNTDIHPFPNSLITSQKIYVTRPNMKFIEVNTKPGVFNISGRIYIKGGAKAKEMAGGFSEVALNPSSKVSDFWYDSVCVKGKQIVGEPAANYAKLIKVSTSDLQGHYAFQNIPAGEYYLSTRLYWFDESPMSGPELYGGLIVKKINFSDGTVTVDLNQEDACKGNYRFRKNSIF